MNKPVHKLIVILLCAVLFCSSSLTVLADEIRAGTVKGLPEKLVVLDDKGQSVSENGEYYFSVENMQEAEHYTKNVTIMNLREDAAYRIDFLAQPVSKSGELDLENDCKCVIKLDDKVVYEGKVTGEGTPDIRTKPLDLGHYVPGESHVMNVDIVWIDSGHGGKVDNGARIVDSSGTTIVREPSGVTHLEGEVIFKWIFTAVVDIPDDSDSSQPDTPVKTGETITFIVFGVATLAMAIMLMLVLMKRKKQKEKEKQ